MLYLKLNMKWINVELIQLFDILALHTKELSPSKIIQFLIKAGELIIPQLDKYSDGKYRSDRNEVLGFFTAIQKFSSSQLSISSDYVHTLIKSYKKRILPYPHYSGIMVYIPENILDVYAKNDFDLLTDSFPH